MTDSKQLPRPQVEKFREAAKELEADDREEVFDTMVKRVAKATPSKEAPKPGAK